MTQWVGWNVVRNFFGTKYSTVKLTDTAFCFSPHVPAPYRVILSEAAPPTKNHARPPIIAAQSNPAPSGAPAGGISLAKWHHATPRTIQHPQFDIFSKRGLTERGKSCIIEPSQCDLGNINTVAVASSFIGGSNFFLPPKRSEGGDKMGYITLAELLQFSAFVLSLISTTVLVLTFINKKK